MLNREFTKKEIALILVLVALLIGAGYYQFVYRDFDEKMASFDTTDLEDQLATEQARALSIQNMQKEMAANKSANTGVVETYSNLKQEISALNDIFEGTTSFNLGFDAATASSGDDTVRRNIQVTFTSADFNEAVKVLQSLHDCKYRCMIKDLAFSPAAGTNSANTSTIENGPVQVTLTVTFYETLYNAANQDGLVMTDDNSGTADSSLTEDLAASKEAAENTGSSY